MVYNTNYYDSGFTSTRPDYTDSVRVSCTYSQDLASQDLYINGVSVSSIGVSGSLLGGDGIGTIYIGSSSSVWRLNSRIKNFKILPYAASADEIASWGAPK